MIVGIFMTEMSVLLDQSTQALKEFTAETGKLIRKGVATSFCTTAFQIPPVAGGVIASIHILAMAGGDRIQGRIIHCDTGMLLGFGNCNCVTSCC